MYRQFTVLLVLLISIGASAWGQPDYMLTGYKDPSKGHPIDTLRLQITYEYTQLRPQADTTLRDVDRVVLEIGRHTNKSYSHILYCADTMNIAALARGARTVDMPDEYGQREVLYYDARTDSMTIRYRTFVYSTHLQWREPLPEMRWTFGIGQRAILGYTCYPATIRFRGRSYTAWYSPAIPIPYGPWSFHGLPGLILSIADEKGEVAFHAVSMRQGAEGETIDYWDWPAKEVSRAKARRAIQAMHRRPYAYLGDYSKYIFADGWGPKASFTYNPIELE